MKLSYEKLSEKIAVAFLNNKDMTLWQKELTVIIEKAEWTREEWETVVHRCYESRLTKK